MNKTDLSMNRRTFVMSTGIFVAAVALGPQQLLSADRDLIRRAIPSTGELLPVMGMGTWRTHDTGDNQAVQARLAEVMQVFFDSGGRVIDSSPMYGRAESVVGDLLETTGNRKKVFAATKVWTDGRQNGIEQMQQSQHRLGVEIDLMQIHNLRDWEVHLPVLREWKTQGLLRYIGITTSHGRFHEELERILSRESLDFVQFTYNLEDRRVEERLLPLAADKGIATLINRPFQGGRLFAKTQDAPLPDWSLEIGCRSWGQFFLKFIIAHPAVTCVIPATSKLSHMRDNMEAGFGRLPDAKMSRRMIGYYESL